MKRRKPIACLLSACRRKTCRTRAGPNSAAGRRGRRRSAYEAPRAAADRRTRLGGAESKRRRCPRLPAPPSRVTLLGELAGGAPEKDEADRRVHDHEGQMRRQAVAEERLLRGGTAEEVDPPQLARPEVRGRDRKRGEEEDDGEEGQERQEGHVHAEERQREPVHGDG